MATVTLNANAQPQTLWAPVLQGAEYTRIANEYVPQQQSGFDYPYYTFRQYMLVFASVLGAHGLRFLAIVLISSIQKYSGGKKSKIIEHVDRFVTAIEVVVYLFVAGIAGAIFAMTPDQSTIRLVPLQWLTLSVYFIGAGVAAISLRREGGAVALSSSKASSTYSRSRALYIVLPALLIVKMGEDTVRLRFYHLMGGAAYAVASTFNDLDGAAAAIPYAALIIGDSLLVVAGATAIPSTPLPSTFLVWNTAVRLDMQAFLILLWFMAAAGGLAIVLRLVAWVMATFCGTNKVSSAIYRMVASHNVNDTE
jgi:hypothetical protein